MRACSFCVILAFVVNSAAAFAANSDLKEVERLLKENRGHIRELIEKREELKQEQERLVMGRRQHESSFKSEIRNRLAVLLHWPLLSFSLADGFWIRREQNLMTLAVVRQRLLEKPLQTVREVRGRLSAAQEELQSIENEFERAKARDNMLSLQVEELNELKGNR